VIDIGTLINSH